MHASSPLVFGFLLVLWIAAGSPAQEAAPRAVSDEAPTFAWPVPSSAVVIKEVEKASVKAKMRSRLAVSAEEGGGLRARMSDFEFLEINGNDVTTPEMKEALAPVQTMTQAVPDLLVDGKGNYLHIDGIEAMIERAVKFQGESKGRSKAANEQILELMRSPMMIELLQHSCSVDWNTWVGGWIGFDSAPGRETVGTIDMPMMGGTLPAKVTRRHLGAVAEHAGHVRLSSVLVAEGPEATAAFIAMMQRVAEQPGGRPFAGDRLEAVRAETALEVITDPRTLLPLRASRTKTIRITMQGEEPQEQVERADYTFEWAKVSDPK